MNLELSYSGHCQKGWNRRFCSDFRKLNNISKKSSWPLLVTDNMLAALGKAKYFTTLDLDSGYWQIPQNEEHKEKMAFSCHRGLCKYNIMPLVWPMPLEYTKPHVNSLAWSRKFCYGLFG